MTKKFTFKTERSTGRIGSFYPNQHYIKFNKKQIGNITDREWNICLQVYKNDINEDGNPNCKWKRITLRKESKSLQEAKDFLNENFDRITNKYNLYTI